MIHAHLHEGAFLGIFLKKFLKIPLLFDCQGSLTTELTDHGFVGRGSLLFRIFTALERFINRNADFIITSSSQSAAELREKWRIEAAKACCLMDGVNCEEFKPYPREEARRELHLPPDKPLAVFLGVLNRYQGIDILLEVMITGERPRQLSSWDSVKAYRRRALNELMIA
jgi:glycosyltransferase involved in cell wall biosynthesis